MSDGNGATDQDKRGRFLPGNRIAKGRRGSRNKLGEKFLDALLVECRRSGKRALEKASATNPPQFCKMIPGLLPKEMAPRPNVNTNLKIRIKLKRSNNLY